VEIRADAPVDRDELVALYTSVGWSTYTDEPERLSVAVENSSIVVTARDEKGTLIGLARGLSDDASVFYLQDILVRPEFQRQGIGHRLLAVCLERYGHVRQKVLLTDDDEAQRRFYEGFGYRTPAQVDASLNAYVRFDD
jgi:GNAT superfamily N-acetyltransferase